MRKQIAGVPSPLNREGSSTEPAELRSFGRKKGRKLSPRQAALIANLLPALALDLATPCTSAVELFVPPVDDVWLEIGFGGGEHLLWQAECHPNVGLIGCEPFLDGVVKVLSGIDAQGLRNLRLYDQDARTVLRWLPKASIDRAFILFPDPWPKKRHVKRRLVSLPTLQLLARVMKPGAELRVATDIADYARTTMLAIAACPQFEWPAHGPSDWRERPADWPSTRYQIKADKARRRCYFFRFRRGA